MDYKQQSQTLNTNARFLGIDLFKCFDEAGKKIAIDLIKKYNLKKTFGIICGLGGNGVDGLATALHLAQSNASVTVYLAGRHGNIEHPVGKIFWDKLSEMETSTFRLLKLKQECYNTDIEKHDIILEALVGTGINKKNLNKRFKDIIKSISHFDAHVISMDLPAPHYIPDFTYSIIYPKSENNNLTLQVKLPDEILYSIGPGDVQALRKPKKSSHKNKNGNLLILSSSEKDKKLFEQIAKGYECSLSFKLINSLNEDFENIAKSSDSILLYDLEYNFTTKSILKELFKLFEDKTFIFNHSLISEIGEELILNIDKKVILNDKLLKKNKIVNSKGYSMLSEQNGTREIASKLRATVVELGLNTLISDENGNFKMDKNPYVSNKLYRPLIKGLVATLSCTNDIDLSSTAGAFLSKLVLRLNGNNDVNKITKNIEDGLEECFEF